MSFLDSLKSLYKPEFLENANKIGFFGKRYHPIFFFVLIEHLKNNISFSVEHISLLGENKNKIKTRLSLSFLGQQMLYWLGNINDLSQKDREYWLSYISSYSGPHILMFFSNNAAKSVDVSVELQEKLSLKDALSLVSFFFPHRSYNSKLLLSNVANYVNEFPFDLALMFSFYGRFLGKGVKDFVEGWLFNILPCEASLFTLSQYFFAKKQRSFAQQWARVFDKWPPLFWISFWSDQLFRASMYVYLMEKRMLGDAKKVSRKLPFSFINFDWKKNSYAELCNAHNFLYGLDFELKNGGKEYGLDLFYMKFFLNNFS